MGVLTRSSLVVNSVRIASAAAPYLLVFAQHGEPTEFQEYVVEHILLLAGDAFDDVHAMTG